MSMSTPWPLPRIIGLIGPRRVGKDTIATALHDAADYQPLALATPLLTLVTTLWPDGFPRTAMTDLGATIRARDPLALIHVVTRTITAAPANQRWVITDIRLPLEYTTFRTTFGSAFAAIAVTADPAIRAVRIAESHRSDGLRETPTSGQDITETWGSTPPADVNAVWDTSDVTGPHPSTVWFSRFRDPQWWAAHPVAPSVSHGILRSS